MVVVGRGVGSGVAVVVRAGLCFAVGVGVAVVVRVVVRMRFVGMTVGMSSVAAVIVTGVGVAEGEQADHVYEESTDADDEEFFYVAELVTFEHAFHGFPNKFYAHEPVRRTLADGFEKSAGKAPT